MNGSKTKCLIRGCGRCGFCAEKRTPYAGFGVVSRLVRHFVHFFAYYRAGGRAHAGALAIGRKKVSNLSKRQTANTGDQQ